MAVLGGPKVSLEGAATSRTNRLGKLKKRWRAERFGAQYECIALTRLNLRRQPQEASKNIAHWADNEPKIIGAATGSKQLRQ